MTHYLRMRRAARRCGPGGWWGAASWSGPRLIRRLERHQRRREQRAADVADLVRWLKERRARTSAEA